MNGSDRALHGTLEMAVVPVPKFDAPVGSRRCQEATVGTGSQSVHTGDMSLPTTKLAPLFEVPNMNGAVVIAMSQAPSRRMRC